MDVDRRGNRLLGALKSARLRNGYRRRNDNFVVRKEDLAAKPSNVVAHRSVGLPTIRNEGQR